MLADRTTEPAGAATEIAAGEALTEISTVPGSIATETPAVTPVMLADCARSLMSTLNGC
jgi:hypothetical protein